MLQNGEAETEVQLEVALCNFMQVHCCPQQSLGQDYNNVTRSLITTWGRLAIHKLKLNFAWYLCCVSVACTIVFTNSHSAGRAK